VHDLDPQDQPRQCGLPGSDEPSVQQRLAAIRQPVAQGPDRFASREEEADLSTLRDVVSASVADSRRRASAPTYEIEAMANICEKQHFRPLTEISRDAYPRRGASL
jgi:hypothetical protein